MADVKKGLVVHLVSGSVGWTERSALRALKEQLFVHKSDLMSAFQEFDPNNTGMEKSREQVCFNPINCLCYCLCIRDDLLTPLGQCHREGAEPGPALEGAAPPARQQHRVRHGGLPAVDTGILHHRAQTRGERKTIGTCGSGALVTHLLLQIADNSILETMYRNHCNLETIFRIIDTDHSGSGLR